MSATIRFREDAAHKFMRSMVLNGSTPFSGEIYSGLSEENEAGYIGKSLKFDCREYNRMEAMRTELSGRNGLLRAPYTGTVSFQSGAEYKKVLPIAKRKAEVHILDLESELERPQITTDLEDMQVSIGTFELSTALSKVIPFMATELKMDMASTPHSYKSIILRIQNEQLLLFGTNGFTMMRVILDTDTCASDTDVALALPFYMAHELLMLFSIVNETVISTTRISVKDDTIRFRIHAADKPAETLGSLEGTMSTSNSPSLETHAQNFEEGVKEVATVPRAAVLAFCKSLGRFMTLYKTALKDEPLDSSTPTSAYYRARMGDESVCFERVSETTVHIGGAQSSQDFTTLGMTLEAAPSELSPELSKFTLNKDFLAAALENANTEKVVIRKKDTRDAPIIVDADGDWRAFIMPIYTG